MSEKEKRGLFEAIFGKRRPNHESFGGTPFSLLSLGSQYESFTGDAWEIATVRAAVDAFARNAAKVQPRHIIRKTEGSRKDADGSRFNRLLQFKPNKYMTAYAFYYRLAAFYCTDNNAFIYIIRDKDGKIVELWPMASSRVELLESNGEMYARITFANGERVVRPYEDLIHIRRHFKDNDIFGDRNDALLPVLGTAKAFNQSMTRFAKLISVVRGILKVSQPAKDEDLAKWRENFIKENIKLDSKGEGVIITDAKQDYIPLKDKEIPVPKGQLEYIRREIYDYIGVNDAIIQNNADAEQMDAFYRGTLSPFYMQLSQGLTNGLFTERERAFGNEVLCELDRLQFATLTSRVSAAQFLTSVGAASLDQLLDIFGMPPIGGEEGARRVQTLNMVNAEIADAYQMLNVGGNTNEDGENSPKNEEDKNG